MRIVLDITVQACNLMRSAGPVQRQWDERVLALRLGKMYLKPLADDLHLMVLCESPEHTPEMLEGTVSPLTASRIDIRLISRWEQQWEDVYFTWECKKVSDKRVDPRNDYLIGRYVSDGVIRFINGAYSLKVGTAGMIGFVLAGDVSNIVNDINHSMLEPSRLQSLTTSDHIKLSTARQTPIPIYESHHLRITAGPISLLHLFLALDYE